MKATAVREIIDCVRCECCPAHYEALEALDAEVARLRLLIEQLRGCDVCRSGDHVSADCNASADYFS
jgi:hypothetical protein